MECFLDSSSNTFLMRSPSSLSISTPPNLNSTVLVKNINVQEDIDGNRHVIAYTNIDNNGDQLPIMLPSDNLVQVISDYNIRPSLLPCDESILANEKRNDKQRRQRLISEKLNALQSLVPHSHKRDHATILDDAAQYIKSLKLYMDKMVLQWNGESLYQQAPYAAHQTSVSMMSWPDKMQAADCKWMQ